MCRKSATDKKRGCFFMADNEKGLKLLMENVQDYQAGDKSLLECLEQHQKICFREMDSHVEYFSDGWTKDTTLNLLKYVVRAVEGDSKAYDRLRIDLGIDDCNLTIVQVQ